MLILSVNWPLTLYALFLGLILLIVLLVVIRKQFENKNENKNVTEENDEKNPKGISGAESAAIAMALHLYYAVHDEESNVITIKNIHSRYSPWNSKIYGIQ